MAGKVITREWTSRGPLGRRVKHVAYGYDVTINGKRERRFDGAWTCENDALEELLKRQRDAEAGRAAPVNRTLGELVDEYLRYKADQGKRSLREDTRILKRYILPAFGPDLRVRRLTTAMIGQYERQRAGKVSAYTLANDLTVLRHMLRLGKRWGYRDDVPEIAMPKKPAARERYLEEAEIDKLLTACAASRNPYLAAIVALALNTGMRKGELLGLTWERIDLTADYGLSARLTLYKTKSGKPRGIPLNHDAIATLAGLEATPEARVGAVFKRGNGAEWGQVRTAFATALRRAGIEHFRFHDLRHTFASHFMMRGGSLYDLKEILGHSDIKMTARYAHLSPHHLRTGVERLKGLATAPTAHETAQNGRLGRRRALKSAEKQDAPVAQVDRAAVS
jgi:integrase